MWIMPEYTAFLDAFHINQSTEPVSANRHNKTIFENVPLPLLVIGVCYLIKLQAYVKCHCNFTSYS
jgi:hypothetical protein